MRQNFIMFTPSQDINTVDISNQRGNLIMTIDTNLSVFQTLGKYYTISNKVFS